MAEAGIETWTASRNAEETDVDQTFVGTLSSVISGTKVNALPACTSEILHFATTTFLDNGLISGPSALHRASVVRRWPEPDDDIRRLFHFQSMTRSRGSCPTRSAITAQVRHALQLHPAAFPQLLERERHVLVRA